MLSRRGLITGLVALVAAPAVVRASSLMPVKAIVPEELGGGWVELFDPAHPRIIRLRWSAVFVTAEDHPTIGVVA